MVIMFETRHKCTPKMFIATILWIAFAQIPLKGNVNFIDYNLQKVDLMFEYQPTKKNV